VPSAPLLEMRGIGKSFPGVRALHDVSLELRAGEVLALVGENGAGKSTLMKILSGAQRADEGSIFVDGRQAQIDSPRSAERYGIGMIYQEFTLVPQLDAVENIGLGSEPSHASFIDVRALRQKAEKALAELGLQLPLDVPAERLSVGQQQVVEIAKALARNARIIVMDEPSAALSDREIEGLFAIVARLKAAGAGIIYISHRMDELPRIADRIAVLRDGAIVETRDAASFPRDEIVRAMVGRQLTAYFPDIPPLDPNAPAVLTVEGLRSGTLVRDVSFTVHAGEIVALAGLIGAGRTEILRAIAGADRREAGIIAVDGKPVGARNPAGGIRAGIAFITEDRKAQGLVLGMTVRENVTLAHLREFVGVDRLIDRERERVATKEEIASLHIRTTGTEQSAGTLSGGNQQKVVLAKWLLGKARVFLFDEPTRGIDVGAKAEIYGLMLQLAARGAAIVMVSSDLPEVLGMSHRILVVRGGAIVAEFPRRDASAERVIAIATGAAA
jgi:ribose transport system ATP-binding protein